MAIEFDTRPDTAPPGVQKALDAARHEVAAVLNGDSAKVSDATYRNLRDRRDDPSIKPYWEALTAWETSQQASRATQPLERSQPLRRVINRGTSDASQVQIVSISETEANTGPLKIKVSDTYTRPSHAYYDTPQSTTRHTVELGKDRTVDLSDAQTRMLAFLAAENQKGEYVSERELDAYAFEGHDVSLTRQRAVRTKLLQKVNTGRRPLIDFQPASGNTPAKLGIVDRDVVFVPTEHFPAQQLTKNLSLVRGGNVSRSPKPA